MRLADLFVNEFIRLGVSTETDPYSGLLAEPGDIVAQGREVVRVFDDYDSGYYGKGALGALQSVTEATLAEIWDILKPFEI